jgi:hypothetical protein
VGSPASWDVKSKEYYSHRKKKSDADKVLLTKYDEKFPQAGREDVKNTIRSNFKKKLHRTANSKKSGAGSKDAIMAGYWLSP